MNLKKTVLTTAMTTVIGFSATTASADTIMDMGFSGWFTMLNGGGTGALVNSDASGNAMYGRRTAVTGTMNFNLDTGAGGGTMAAFSFFGGGLASATTISFQAIGNGSGGAGPLVLGNLGFNWNSNNGIPVSIVLDASGFFGAVQGGLATSDIVTGGVLGATDGMSFNFGKKSYTLPIGAVPIATTTFNTTDIGTVGLGSNPSGTLPLTDDGIGGSPMKAGPFPGFNANFDITDLHISKVTVTGVPVPAAVWLFGSGLLGLAGVARRRKKA